MEKQEFQEILRTAKSEGTIVSLYGDGSNSFSAGFVLAMSDNDVVLESLSPRGFCDGWLSRPMDDIARIEIGGRYEERLLTYYRVRGETHQRNFLPEISMTSDLKAELLEAARAHDYAVTVNVGSDADVIGFVRKVAVETVTIECYTEYGQPDGDSFLSLESIEKVHVGDDELQDLKLLARWHDAPPL